MEVENRLIFIHSVDDGSNHSKALYQCKCGNIKIARISHVISNKIRSCNCLRKENKQGLKHGMYGKTEWNIWSGMRNRCLNKNHQEYSSYGGRGIKVCQLWEYSFEEFYRDMGKRPNKKYTLDRIDNNNGYFPKNCRWALQSQQHNNKRSNRIIQCNNEEMTLTQWSRKLNIKVSTLINRLKIMDVELAFTIPVQKPFGNP